MYKKRIILPWALAVFLATPMAGATPPPASDRPAPVIAPAAPATGAGKASARPRRREPGAVRAPATVAAASSPAAPLVATATPPRPPAAGPTRAPTAPVADNPLRQTFKPTERFVDLRDLLAAISQQTGLSLMVSRAVRGNLNEVKGETVEQVLQEALAPRGFEWRLYDGCLYVGERGLLDDLWKVMHIPLKAKITRGKRLNADFRNLELPTIGRILRNFSGIDIRFTEHITGNMTMRIIDMPWERVLLGIVYLNGFRMMETDFSILISP